MTSLFAFALHHWAITLVLVGVIGETFCECLKESRLRSIIFRFSAGLLVIGLFGELHEAAETDRQIADLKRQNADLTRQNLVVRSNLIALEIEFQPRRITAKQEQFIAAALGTNQTHQIVEVIAEEPDTERLVFGSQITKVLRASGFDARLSGWQSIRISGVKRIEFGLRMQVNPQGPQSAISIIRAFRGAGLQLETVLSTNVPTDTIRMSVGWKPNLAPGYSPKVLFE